MDFSQRRKILLIINPCAGKRQALGALGDIVQLFCSNDCDVAVFVTSARGEACDIVQQTGSEYDIVSCCGGDGTLNEVLSGILRGGLKTPVGYIPCGTTNDFASTLGLPKKIMKAAKNVISGRVMQQDIGLFNDSRYFTYIASFGAFTRASYATPQRAKNIWGHLAYVMQGLHDVGDIKPFEVTVTHDGITESGSYIFGSVTNSTSVGGVMKLSTDTVNVRDGLFELMLVKTPTNPSKIGKMLNDVVTQQYDGNPVSLFHCSHFRFESKTPLSWTIDGEAGGEHALTTLECLHGAVNIIVP